MFPSPPYVGALLGIIGFAVYQGVSPSIAYLTRLKGIILRGRVKAMVLRLGRPTEVAHLDGAALERATKEVESFGFVAAGDYVSFSIEGRQHQATMAPISSPQPVTPAPPPSPNNTASFLRVLLHEEKRCVVKLMAVSVVPTQIGVTKTRYVRAIISFADAPDGGDIWSYATSDASDSGGQGGIRALFRRPRALSTRVPDAKFPQLWGVHLSRREQIAQVTGFHWNRATLREALDAEARANANIRAAFARLTPLKMAWLLRRYKREKNKTEWLGELRGKVPPLSP